jgi:hypothetical protein
MSTKCEKQIKPIELDEKRLRGTKRSERPSKSEEESEDTPPFRFLLDNSFADRRILKNRVRSQIDSTRQDK